jgi:sugar O-acyltransferase (sialic acid O-acetyltransferase NeuD family)
MLEAVRAVNRQTPAWEFLGFLAEGERAPERARNLGAEILGPVELLWELDAGYLIGVGSSQARYRLDESISTCGREAAILRHPAAVTGDAVSIGPGGFVAAGAVVTTNVDIGRHSHIGIGASVSHDCMIGSYCSIGPGARIAGGASVGDFVEVGIGAVVLPGVAIGAGAVVGGGAAVTRDVEPGVVVAGVPARRLDSHDVGLPTGWERP